jgi:FkbM family methyltransferase
MDLIQDAKVLDTNVDGVSAEIIETLLNAKNYIDSELTLLDIGAHKGFFAKGAAEILDIKKSFCFEPNTELHNDIDANLGNRPYEIVESPLAATSEKKQFFIHGDSTMSSLVDVDKDELKKEFPYDDPEQLKVVEVESITLDQFAEKKGETGDRYLLKIDTQGNELNILRNGLETLKKTNLCLIEHMFYTPYKSDYDFIDLIEFMDENRFKCMGATSIARRQSHKVCSVDFMFIKK